MCAQQLYQNDVRWKSNPIGLQNALTIDQVGCMLTSLAMTVNHFGGQVTPASLNETAKAAGAFNGPWIKSAQIPGLFPQLGFKRQKWVQCEGTPAPLDVIDAALEAGSLVMVRVDWTPDANIDSHWVVLHQKQGDDYLMWDPWQKQGATDTLMGRYGYAGKGAADVILEAIWHGKGDLPVTRDRQTSPQAAKPGKSKKTQAGKRDTGVTETPPAEPETTPEEPATAVSIGKLWVQPTVTQLTLRRQPYVAENNVIQYVMAADRLRVLEDESAARAKLGQQEQWLRVRAPGGEEGYIAAWHSQETDPPAQPQQAASGTASKPEPSSTLTVKTTAEGVSLRRRPVVLESTLIRYLPKGMELTVVEGETAVSKIGVQGQWLQVRTANGTEGYVAAWFVTR